MDICIIKDQYFDVVNDENLMQNQEFDHVHTEGEISLKVPISLQNEIKSL